MVISTDTGTTQPANSTDVAAWAVCGAGSCYGVGWEEGGQGSERANSGWVCVANVTRRCATCTWQQHPSTGKSQI